MVRQADRGGWREPEAGSRDSGVDFTARTLRVAQEGLELIAKNNMAGLADLLSCTKKEARDTAEVIRGVENRQSTMERLLKEILQYQQGFFFRGEPLKAMTMGDLAERLGLGIAISRRTVAKYREKLGIPGSSQRRQRVGVEKGA